MEAKLKQLKKKNHFDKMKKFAQTVGVEDNDAYTRCQGNQKLIMNVSTSKYFVVRFVAKNLFNYHVSFQALNEIQTDYNIESLVKPSKIMQQNEDWDIFWTDHGVGADRVARMKPY